MSIVVSVALFFFVIRIWLSSFSGIHPDEAYYWTWAQSLRLGYFDHPPMVAWVIAASEWVAVRLTPEAWQQSDTYRQIAFRWLPFSLSCVGTPILLGACVRRLQHQAVSFSQILCVFLTPLFFFGPQVVTPDAPFFFGVALCLYFTIRTRNLRGPNPIPGSITPFSFSLSFGMGLALAFSAYSKYTAILLLFFYVLSGAGLVNTLLAALVSGVFVLPYFYWTAFEGREIGAGIFFQLQNALATPNTPIQWKRLGDLVGSQFILWGPFSFAAFLFFAIKNFKNRAYLIFWSLAPLLFFAIGGLRRPAEANWPLMGAIPAFVFLLIHLSRRPIWTFWISTFNLGAMFLALVVLLNGNFVAPFVQPFAPTLASKLEKPSRLEEFRGWKRFREFLFEATSVNKAPILVDRYQLLSSLLFYDASVPQQDQLGERLKIWQKGGSRRSQFDTDPRYIFDGVGDYWILLEDLSKKPQNCKYHQSLFRDEAPQKDYFVLRCS